MVRKSNDGRWEGRIVVGYNEKNLPVTKCVTAKTKTECADKLEKLKEQYGRITEKIKADMLFGQWIDFWYQPTADTRFASQQKANTKTASTITLYPKSEKFR